MYNKGKEGHDQRKLERGWRELRDREINVQGVGLSFVVGISRKPSQGRVLKTSLQT